MSDNVEILVTDEGDESEEGKRQRSAIAFPYSDFDGALKVASAIHGNAGHGACTSGQLAAWMTQSSKSSGFRTQLAAARLFGLIESDSPDAIRLSTLGGRVLDPSQTRGARAEAFLRVPLFKALYETHKDGLVPPAAALEREIVGLGVSEKQKQKARQVFDSSSNQTGFRETPNKLVMPAVHVPAPKIEENHERKGGSGGGGDGFDLDPLLMALLRKIPQSNGGQWPAENRLRWFRTFAMNVSQVYDADDQPVELDIKLKSEQKQ